MKRFLLFALPLLVVLSALFHLALEILGLEPELGPLVGWHAGDGLPGSLILATWGLEALALTALYLLVDARGGSRWLNGLLAAWIAWVFRGPLLVMTAVGFGGHPPEPWWGLAARWFVLYTLAGLLLAALAILTRLGSEASTGTEPGPQPEPPVDTRPASAARRES